jgi:[ribosomal protein S18]-alanine N-acetyltransferase
VKILVIRSATIQHIPAIVTLDRLCFGELWTADGYAREINSSNSDLFILTVVDVAEATDRISQKRAKVIGIGCMWSILEEAHITLLGIHPDYQRQGLGKFLLVKFLQAATNRQLTRATLEVRTSNRPAIALYEALGFRHAGIRRKYYAKTGEDALILWRSGLNHPKFAQKLNEWERESRERLKLNNWSIHN